MPIGLTSPEAAKLLTQHGTNVLKTKRKTPLIVQFFKQFTDLMVIILILASVFAYAAAETVDASIILGIVFLNALIGFMQEFKAEKAIEALKKLLAPKARVVRDGVEQLIESMYLVPGDVVIMGEGDKVSADCELFEANEILVDEAILTGESLPVAKNHTNNKTLCMGTEIVHGTGKAVVVATGMETQFGRIALLTTSTQKDKSPLQKELEHIGIFVGKITLVISTVLFAIGYFLQHRPMIENLLFAVSVAVAAVPEGLPTTITVALALGVQRLARKNAIVKQLSSVETLGCTTVICSDKTGTLTKNEMTVKEILFGDCEAMIEGVGYEPTGSFSVRSIGESGMGYSEYGKGELHQLAYKHPTVYEHLELLIRGVVVCNNARLTKGEDRWTILGDPTEGALITLAEKGGFTHEKVSEKHKRIFEIPFDSNRKCMTVLAKTTGETEYKAYVKGAPDILLAKCSSILWEGAVQPLTDEVREKIMKRTEEMAEKALRVIAVAYRNVPHEMQGHFESEKIETDLIFVGAVGMIDPPREEVKEAIKLAHKGGIRVIVITGDHALTAHAIARELGIVHSFGVELITGEKLNALSDVELHDLVKPGRDVLFARVSPEHKLRIVEALKKNGEVVAVTGDGVNDAPALKRADIGVAMGITGTDVSKEAANMVLTDDSFSTIITAIIEGRTIYENMRKFIFFIFSSNIGELIAIFVTLLMGLPAPLTAVLILIINTLTDVFPALALGVEPIEKNILDRPPRKQSEKIMVPSFIRRYVMNGFVIGLTATGVFLWGLSQGGWHFGEGVSTTTALYTKATTMVFVFLTFVQMVHAFNSRSSTLSVFRMNFFSNPALIGAVLFSLVGTVLAVELPAVQVYLKTTSLHLNEWGLLFLLSFGILVFEEMRKFILRSSAKS